MITFKEENMVGELMAIDPKLFLILADAHEYLCRVHNQKFMMVTSVIRKDNPNSVHYYGRGVDTRSLHLEQNVIDSLLEYINNKYPYDIERPALKTVIHHRVEGRAYHLHWQVKKGD